MLEAGINTWISTILFPFMPVITVFIVSALMLSDLPWNDDDDDDDGGGLISPVYNYVPQGAQGINIKMIFISSLFNSFPSSAKDLLEFGFFLTVGFTAGKVGLL